MGAVTRPRDLKAEIAPELFPEARFPAVYIQLVRVEYSDRHRCISSNDLIGRNIFRAQLKLASLAFAGFSQTIDREAQVRQDIVINDIVKEYRVRIERFLGQDDAVVKGLFVANGSILIQRGTGTTLEGLVKKHCERTHNSPLMYTTGPDAYFLTFP